MLTGALVRRVEDFAHQRVVALALRGEGQGVNTQLLTGLESQQIRTTNDMKKAMKKVIKPVQQIE